MCKTIEQATAKAEHDSQNIDAIVSVVKDDNGFAIVYDGEVESKTVFESYYGGYPI